MNGTKVTAEVLDTYGPFTPQHRSVVLFSVGNDFEAHGYAMPPHIDSLVAREWCLALSRRFGLTYCAHIPYSTDSVGEIARNWSPAYLPFDDFYTRLRDFVSWHIGRLSFNPSKVVIIVGHGGNRQLFGCEKDLAEAFGCQTRVLGPAASSPLEYPEFEAIDTVYDIVAKGGEHAYILEHSWAAHFGYLDFSKLDEMNRVAAQDPTEALRRWPAIAGLGGFIAFGGPEYDPLREMEGLSYCLEDFKMRRKIIADPELGRRAVALVVEYLCEQLGG